MQVICPAGRACKWTVESAHHDWWTTSAGAWLLAVAMILVAAIILIIAALRHNAVEAKYEHDLEMQRMQTEHVEYLRSKGLQPEPPTAATQEMPRPSRLDVP